MRAKSNLTNDLQSVGIRENLDIVVGGIKRWMQTTVREDHLARVTAKEEEAMKVGSAVAASYSC